MKKTAAITVGVALTLGLAGCATAQTGTDGTATHDPESPAAPHPLLDVACAELIDDDALVAAYGEVLPERAASVEGYGGMGNVAAAALTLAGATRCAWGHDAVALDVDVLPAAAAEWTRLEADLRMFQPKEGAHGAGTWFTCHHTNERPTCLADVLAGDHWVAVRAQQVLGADVLDALLVPIVSAISDAEASAPDWAVASATTDDCATLLPLEVVQGAIGDDVEPWTERGAILSQTLRQAALDRVGAVHCAWRNGFGSAVARTIDLTIMPGGDLVWEGHFAAPVPAWVEREPLDLGDAGFSAVHTSSYDGGIDGVASVLVDGTWIDVWANDEARDDDLDIAVSLAEAVVANVAA